MAKAAGPTGADDGISLSGIFLSAEGAFVLMALREYLQDMLGLTESELIANRPGRQSTVVQSL